MQQWRVKEADFSGDVQIGDDGGKENPLTEGQEAGAVDVVQRSEEVPGNGGEKRLNGEMQNTEEATDNGGMENPMIVGQETGGVVEAENSSVVEAEVQQEEQIIETDTTVKKKQGGDGDESTPEGETSANEKSVAVQAPSSNGGSLINR
ncbi:unnamed protein product [Linum trigynum]|uniref:Uncharacterized protein n=1 Tax=Linum trigynum TaxID=586398 RepID=A0AAV2E398_9ROSI